MKDSKGDHQVRNIVISGLVSLSMFGGNLNLFAKDSMGALLPLNEIFDTLANDTAPGPVLCPPKFAKKCPKPGAASVGTLSGVDVDAGVRRVKGELHGTQAIHEEIREQGGNPYAKMGTEAALKADDCPGGLCNKAAVDAVKAAKGADSMEVVMAEVVNELHEINVFLEDQPEADIVHVPAGNFEGSVRSLQQRYAQATANDGAQRTIQNSDVLKAIDQQYGAEIRAYEIKSGQESNRRGLR